ncbi:MAG: flavodoxin family protein [Desulfovibrio sp.]|nr:flavodoxin family protein [Desulfovibrio sp.]
MKEAVILLCSPRAGGVSDTAARLFSQGLTDAGMPVRLLPLRDYNIAPCTACGACATPPHHCVLSDGQDASSETDDAHLLFDAISSASLLLVASPIYFYHLPAHFKALVDRTQRFWERQHHTRRRLPEAECRPGLAILTAGRLKGHQLFTGALLSLRLFFAPLNISLRENRQLRGMETLANLKERPAVTAGLYAWGHDWGRTCIA